MRLIVLIVSTVLLLVPAAAAAQSGALTPSPEPSAATLTPSPEAMTERPRLHKPLMPPKGAKPVLSTNRPPDATAGRRGVRLELWVPQNRIRTGGWIPATLRITNLSGQPIRHFGQVGCDNGNVNLSFDYSGLFDPGVQWRGKAARFKKLFLRGHLSNAMHVFRPTRSDCSGPGVDETILNGRSVTVAKAAFVNYPMASQPLPSGQAAVEACFRFEFPRSQDPDRYYDKCVSAPVEVKGRKVSYASPYELVDAMLTDPIFHAWVESRYPNAQFHTSMGGPVKRLHFGRWDERGYSGGPARLEIAKVSSMAGGRNEDRVSWLLIDVWTAEVLETKIVAGWSRSDPPVGEYPSPSPLPSSSPLPRP